MTNMKMIICWTVPNTLPNTLIPLPQLSKSAFYSLSQSANI